MLLEEIRQKSLKRLNDKTDDWLYQMTKLNFSVPVNNYYCWFHVMEEEISHIGQIKAFKSKILSLKKK